MQNSRIKIFTFKTLKLLSHVLEQIFRWHMFTMFNIPFIAMRSGRPVAII